MRQDQGRQMSYQGQMVSKVNEICDSYVMFDAGLKSASFRISRTTFYWESKSRPGNSARSLQVDRSGQLVHVVCFSCMRNAVVDKMAVGDGSPLQGRHGNGFFCAPLHHESAVPRRNHWFVRTMKCTDLKEQLRPSSRR